MRLQSAAVGAALLLAVPAHAAEQGNANQDSSAQQQPKHHSKAKGAAVSGAGGAVAGAKKGAAAGAAGGALYQHKKIAKQPQKGEKQQQ